jgi:beta-phosphoglucomutase-like phosphatase (HAD superfamily)
MKYLPYIAIGLLVASAVDPGFVHTSAALRDLGLGQVVDTVSAYNTAIDNFCKEHNITISILSFHYGPDNPYETSELDKEVVKDASPLDAEVAKAFDRIVEQSTSATGEAVVTDSVAQQAASATGEEVVKDSVAQQATSATGAAVATDSVPQRSTPATGQRL